MYKENYLFIVSVLFSVQISASHLLGMEMNYQFLTEDSQTKKYLIEVVLTHDCDNKMRNAEKKIRFSIYNPNDILVDKIWAIRTQKMNIQDSAEGPCMSSSMDRCLLKSNYQAIVTLPLTNGDYRIIYEKCCRENGISNLRVSGSQSMAVESFIPGRAQFNNSTVIIDEKDSYHICKDDELYLDFGGTDPDGDSLVYSFYKTIQGLTMSNKTGILMPPIFRYVTLERTYSQSRPFKTPGKPLSIDSKTGIVNGIPAESGIFQWGIKIDEYRNGKLINSNMIDRSIKIILCSPKLDKAQFHYTQNCSGPDPLHVKFKSIHSKAATELWYVNGNLIQNDPNDTLDYQFSNEGEYSVKLVGNAGLYCADSTIMKISVVEPIDAVIMPYTNPCLGDDSLILNIDTSKINERTLVNWKIFRNGNLIKKIARSEMILYDLFPGKYEVVVNAIDQNCQSNCASNFHINDVPKMNVFVQDHCKGSHLDSDFKDSTQKWELTWQINDSIIDQPSSFIFNDTGRFKIHIAGQLNNNICFENDTFYKTEYIRILPRPKAEFDVQIEEGFGSDEYHVRYVDRSENADYIRFNVNNNQYNYREGSVKISSGDSIAITQVAYSKSNICSDTLVQRIQILKNERVYVPNTFTPNGDGVNDSFRIKYADISNPKLMVFNRSGKEIFQSNDLTNCWDGTYNGRPQKTDSYVYKLSYLNSKNENVFTEGVVNLIR